MFTGEIDFEWTVESFLENPETFIREMDTCAGSQREKREQFILLGIFPYLENIMWGKSSANNIDTYYILALASCSRSSLDVVKHSLNQLQHLLYRDNLYSCKQNLLSVERIMRSSIVSDDGLFREEAETPRLLRLAVYGRFLTELIIQQIPAEFSKRDRKNVKKLKGLFSHRSLTESQLETFTYSIDFIQIAISYLLKSPKEKRRKLLKGYLEECKTLCGNKQLDKIEETGLAFFQKLMESKVKWFDLHCILHYLHGKVRVLSFRSEYVYIHALVHDWTRTRLMLCGHSGIVLFTVHKPLFAFTSKFFFFYNKSRMAPWTFLWVFVFNIPFVRNYAFQILTMTV